MNQGMIVLILVLASTNASKYMQPFHRLQKETIAQQISDNSLDLGDNYVKNHLETSPQFPSDSNQARRFTFEAEPRSYDIVDPHANGADDIRLKRTDTSLSIVNALDVLRQKIILELARRRMNESKAQIQRNRELLMKTGKRSKNNYNNSLNYGLLELQRRMQVEDLSKGALPVVASQSYFENPTTRRDQNEFLFQT